MCFFAERVAMAILYTMGTLPTTLHGTITRFKGNGRKLGYPTANLLTVTDMHDGIYFGFADLAEWSHQPALIFIGTPTTIGDPERRTEVHILDIPDQDYYDQLLGVTLQHYHRPNQTFGSIEALIQAMAADEHACRRWLQSISGVRESSAAD